MTELFYVPYEPKRMFTQTADLTQRAELAYHRLCGWTWAKGKSPPNHAPTLAKISRCPLKKWPAIRKELERGGWTARKNGFCHRDALEALRKARRAHRKCSRVARNAAQQRWHRKAPRTPEPPAQDACPTPDAASMLPASSKRMLPACHKTKPNKRSNQTKEDLQRLTVELSGLTVSAPAKAGEEENRFLKELMLALGDFDPQQSSLELTNWGGWWRLRFREDAEKAWRVLAEVRSMIREKRIRKNAGAAAKDLWNRFA